MDERQPADGLTFTYNAAEFHAEPGQSIAGALHAADVRVLTRSMKYRRPRGVYCAGGYCPNCLVRVDGVGYKRACMSPVRDGMVVESQTRTRPSGLDPMRMIDHIGFLFPLGFQYRLFKRQGRVFNAWEANLRRVAGHARMPDALPPPGTVRRLAADLCVVGGGPAGVGAAAAGLASGLKVVVVASWWGMQSEELVVRRFSRQPPAVRDAALELAAQPEAWLAPARAIGWFDGVTVVDQAGQLVEISSRRSVLATGAYERPVIFDGNDLPGVMLSSAAVKLAYRDGITPGTRAVVVTKSDDGHIAALALHSAGVHVAAVLDERSAPPSHLVRLTREAGIEVATSTRAVRARGSRAVRELTIAGGGRKQRIGCDLVAMNGGWQPADELRYQATSRGQVVVEGEGARSARFTDPRADVDPLLQAVGAAVGTRSAHRAFWEGYVVGLHAAQANGVSVTAELDVATANVAAGVV